MTKQNHTECIALTVSDAAELLSVSEDLVRRLIKDGTVPHVRIGNNIRILRAHLLEYLEAQTTREWSPEDGRGRRPAKPA